MTNVEFAFSELPADIALYIIKMAAALDLSADCSMYTCGPALCRVSKAVRRAALPSMLHTLVFPSTRSVVRFITALRIQRTFAETNLDLFVDYSQYVSRIWLTQYDEPVVPPTRADPSTPRSFRISPPNEVDDLSLLAPVILGASSLVFGDASASLLCDCLAWAWQRRSAVSSSPSLSPPWRTNKLALLGPISRWLPFTSSPEGSAFLASIRSLVVLPDEAPVDDLSEEGWDEEYWGIREDIPLQSFRDLQKLVVPLVSYGLPDAKCMYGAPWKEYVDFKLLVMQKPTTGSMSGTRDWVDNALRAFLRGETTKLNPIQPYFYEAWLPGVINFRWERCWGCNFLDD